MKRILSLVPDATICVAKSEAAAYAKVVPKGRLLFHDDLPGLVAIRNWLNETVQEPCLVEIDDDLKCVYSLIGKRRRIVDPDAIREIIENSVRLATDLDIPVFCWSRTQNMVLLRPEYQPIRFVTPVSCSFGLRGEARQRQFDAGLPGRADFDFTLRTLLCDRILYADVRFYFDHGRIRSGRGGGVGLLTDKMYSASTAKLQDRWGQFVSFKKPGFVKTRTTQAMSVRVRRHNPLVQNNL